MKTKNSLRLLLVIAAVAFGGAAQAQLLSGMVAPAQGKAGEPVKVTLNFDVPSGMNCAMHVHWGDGANDTFKINQVKDVPLQTSHTYAAGGSYKIVAEPKRVGSVLKCGGRNQEAMVQVASVAAPAKSNVSAKASVCPAAWTLAKPGVNKKTQAFTCTAAPGSTLPQAKINCPGDLTYFENAKKGQLGCRP